MATLDKTLVILLLHLTCTCAVFRFVTKLLEDLVFFVVDIPNSGQDVLDIMVNKPSRERQKLMREQNILKQVGFTFTAALFEFEDILGN